MAMLIPLDIMYLNWCVGLELSQEKYSLEQILCDSVQTAGAATAAADAACIYISIS